MDYIKLSIGLVLFILPIYLSHKMDTKLRTSNPHFHPYVFGYYVGLVRAMDFVIDILALAFHYYQTPSSEIEFSSNLVFSMVQSVFAIGYLYRVRLVWIIEIFVAWCSLIIIGIFGFMQGAPDFLAPYIHEDFLTGYMFIVYLVILIPIMACITVYYFKRRHEMPLLRRDNA